MYDIIIIGAGPAGISAGVYAVSRGKNVLVLERNVVGGVVGKVSTVTHYAGIIGGETGETFANRLKEQAEGAGVLIKYENVTEVSLKGDIKKIKTDKAEYEAAKVIIANGTTPRKLGIPGEPSFNAAKDGSRFEGKNIYVVGGADGAVKEALYLSKFAKKLTIIHFEDKLGCIPEFLNKVEKADNIEVKLHSRLKAVYGDGEIEAIDIADEKTGEITKVHDKGCGVFIYAGATPNTSLYTELELEGGFIPVDDKMQTAIPGVYAAGDIRVKQVRQAATAVADGAIAAINAAM